MELGYFLVPLHPPGSDLNESLRHDIDQIVLLDQLGYDEAWIGEHFTAHWETIPIPDMFIAHAFALTKHIKLGTGVTCMPNHDPFMLAHRIAQLDHIGRGRFQWGIGSGGFPGDFESRGFDPKTGDHRSMTKDTLKAVLNIWNNPKPGKYQSKHWSFTIPEPADEIGLRYYYTPYQKPHPPIALAGGLSGKSETLQMAGESGYMPMSTTLVLPSTLVEQWNTIHEGAISAGRTAERSRWRIARDIYVAETTEQARREVLEGTMARDYEQYWLKLLSYGKMLPDMKVDPNIPDSAVTMDYLLDNILIVGSPDDVANKLRDFHKQTGGFGVLIAGGHEWHPKDQWVRSLSLLKQEVMPKLADLK